MMRKYHDYKNCSMCNKRFELLRSTAYGYKRDQYLGDLIRICKGCYDSIPKHIPDAQIRRYVERLAWGRPDA